MHLLDIEYRISSIFLGRLTIFRKTSLKPFSSGREGTNVAVSLGERHQDSQLLYNEHTSW